jgi:hypothetical protein
MRKIPVHGEPDRGHRQAGEGGVPIAETLRQHNISRTTYLQRRSKYEPRRVSRRLGYVSVASSAAAVW